MSELFLSYARDDQEIARRFAEAFEREGLGVWWDQALNPGEAFDQVTEEALAGASAVIVLWSKASVSSRWVRAEATQANANKRLLPVMIEPCTRPIMFELTHTADLTQWKGSRDDPAWQAFLASVRRFVQRRTQGDTGVDPAAMTPVRAPAPSLQARIAAFGAGLLTVIRWLGSLLREFGGRLAFALAGAAVAGLVAWQLQPRLERAVTRFTFEVPTELGTDQSNGFALSPDGRRVVYPGGNQLWSRRLDQDEATQIPGGEGGVQPFFSPDGRSVAFFTVTADPAKNQLKAFDFGNDSVRVLAGFKNVPGVIGSWDDQGRIIFGQMDVQQLSRVAAVGGVPEVVVMRGDYAAVAWQDSLPGGQWVLFSGVTGNGNWGEADIVAQNLASGERKVVLKRGHAARYVPSGHLVFARGGTLYAVAFDARRAEAHGREVPVVQGVATNEANGYAPYAIGADGSLAYVAGAMIGQSLETRSVVHVDQRGENTTSLSAEARTYSTPRASPDGSKVAVEVADSDKRVHIWVMDAKSGSATQLTFDGEEDRFPVWTADNQEVLYTSRRGKEYAIWRKAADGTGEARQVIAGTAALVATDVHEQSLIYQERGASEERDVFILDLKANGKPQILLSTPDDDSSARVSPDGRWLAYVSTPKGKGTSDRRVYVRPFANAAAGGQRSISEGMGAGPVWSPKGDEIYYMVASGPLPIMAAQVSATPTTITPVGRRQLFTLRGRFDLTRSNGSWPYGAIYDVMPTGEFVAVLAMAMKPSGGGSGSQAEIAVRPQIHVVSNWSEELKRLVPTE